jgi:NAD(P)-dependent dehydrogenase (short-subunit alcohol dehydrogenase family)
MTQALFDLTGRVALVTGAASGIGRQTAHTLASLGATVYGTDLNTNALAETMAGIGGRGLGHDVTSPDDWTSAIDAVRTGSGRLDVLVNNAGIMLNRPFLDTTLDEFRNQQQINVESVFLGMKTALPLMLETVAAHTVSPSIINVSSVYGQVAGASFSAYSASKGAVRLMTKAVAFEFAENGIRVNSLHPGPTATNLGAGWEPPRDAEGNLLSPEQAAARWLTLIPNRRFGMPADMAGAIAFLASDASSYMTGSELTVDGGYTAV